MTEAPCAAEVTTGDDEGDNHHLPALMRVSQLPVCLLDLDTHRIVEVSDALAALLGGRRDQIVQRRVTDFLADQTSAVARLKLLATAQLDSYSVRALAYRRLDGSEFHVDACISASGDQASRRTAVGVLMPVQERTLSVTAGHARSHVVALGTVDGELRVDRISGDVEQLLGHVASTVVGQPLSALVDPEDWPDLLIAIGTCLRGPGGATTRLRMRQADHGRRWCRVLVTALGSGVPGVAFSLSPGDLFAETPADRAWELEGYLRRIAREVAASGVLAVLTETPRTPTIPTMAGLSTRELDIVTGLLVGERVAMIAERMFLSPSTVRNHLTSAYRKLGVRSQQELLRSLRDDTIAEMTAGDSA